MYSKLCNTGHNIVLSGLHFFGNFVVSISFLSQGRSYDFMSYDLLLKILYIRTAVVVGHYVCFTRYVVHILFPAIIDKCAYSLHYYYIMCDPCENLTNTSQRASRARKGTHAYT